MTPEQLDRLEQLAREARDGSGYTFDPATEALAAALDPAVVSELVAAARLGAAQARADAGAELYAAGYKRGREEAGLPDSLDAAWQEAEAALPGGFSLSVGSTIRVGAGPYIAVTDWGKPQVAYAYGPTPAAALVALAEALRKMTG